MSDWSVKRNKHREPILVLDGSIMNYGKIIEVLVPEEDDFEDEYVTVS